MNLQQRLDRVERILVLAIRAGDRERREWRRRSREQEEKLNMVIDSHIAAMDRMDKLHIETMERMDKSHHEAMERMDKSHHEAMERMDKLEAAQTKTDERIDKLLIAQEKTDEKIGKLAEEHRATERSLKAFLDGLRKGQNGNSSA